MIPRKPGEVSPDELSSASKRVAGGTPGLSEEKTVAARRVARDGVPSGPALQKAQISNHRPTIFSANAGKPWHSSFRNPVVNHVA
jgi:hypothetical protein